MNGVIGMTALLLDTELTDEQREYVEATRSSADALLTIINDILDFSKIESGKLELEHHPFELHTCIEEALDLLAPKAAEKNLDLAYLVDDAIPKILVSDVTRLRQILVNLIGNAVKFTHAGRGGHRSRRRPRTACAVLEPGQEHDTEFLRHPEQWLAAFLRSRHRHRHPAGQAEPPVQIVSTGRCLHHAPLRRHRAGPGDLQTAGRIDGRKDLGRERGRQGRHVSFHDSRPRVRRHCAAGLADRRSRSWPASGCWSSKTTPPIASIITHRGEQWGMNVEAAANSRDALELLAQGHPFDAVILDLQLPDMDGLALADEIREQPAGRFAPVMLLVVRPSARR